MYDKELLVNLNIKVSNVNVLLIKKNHINCNNNLTFRFAFVNLKFKSHLTKLAIPKFLRVILLNSFKGLFTTIFGY